MIMYYGRDESVEFFQLPDEILNKEPFSYKLLPNANLPKSTMNKKKRRTNPEDLKQAKQQIQNCTEEKELMQQILPVILKDIDPDFAQEIKIKDVKLYTSPNLTKVILLSSKYCPLRKIIKGEPHHRKNEPKTWIVLGTEYLSIKCWICDQNGEKYSLKNFDKELVGAIRPLPPAIEVNSKEIEEGEETPWEIYT